MDYVNSIFQATGGLITFLHVWEVHKYRSWNGTHWAPVVFFFLWGVWSVVFYIHLGLLWSTLASALPAIGNGAHLAIMWKHK